LPPSCCLIPPVEVTFSLDDETVRQIRRTATRLGRPQSQVVREAIADYAARADRLSEGERQRLLGVLEALGKATPTRSARAVREELKATRDARRAGGRRSA
jgi:predicted transcriptional regulator